LNNITRLSPQKKDRYKERDVPEQVNLGQNSRKCELLSKRIKTKINQVGLSQRIKITFTIHLLSVVPPL
jgi:hypothetical protein